MDDHRSSVALFHTSRSSLALPAHLIAYRCAVARSWIAFSTRSYRINRYHIFAHKHSARIILNRCAWHQHRRKHHRRAALIGALAASLRMVARIFVNALRARALRTPRHIVARGIKRAHHGVIESSMRKSAKQRGNMGKASTRMASKRVAASISNQIIMRYQ